jgi:ABC-type methionine transport system ATPase subunit
MSNPNQLVMITPNPNLQVLQNKISLPKKEFIVEIELNGKMKFEHLMNTIYNKFGICHRVLSANVEYDTKGNSFGTVQLYINVNSEDYEQLEFYLNNNKLLNTTVEYVCRKYS